MTLEQIKAAVDAGKVVHWANDGYRVVKDSLGQWFIVCDQNQHAIGLTWSDGVTLNGEEKDFYAEESVKP